MTTVLQKQQNYQEKLPTCLLYGYSINDHDKLQEFLQFLIDHPKTCPALIGLISRILRHRSSETSQETIAMFATCARESVNRMIKAAVEANYIKSMGRFWKTSIYSIGDKLNYKNFARFFLSFVLQAGFNRFWFPIKDYNQSISKVDVTLKDYIYIYTSPLSNLNKEEYRSTSKGNTSKVDASLKDGLQSGGQFINKQGKEEKSSKGALCKPENKAISIYTNQPASHLSHYDNPKGAADYKDFLLNRFERLAEDLRRLGRLELLEANTRQYISNLSYRDQKSVEREVLELKKSKQ